MSTELRKELVKRGYVVSPNNIYGVPGVLMYAGGPGIPCVKGYDLSVQVTDEVIRVFRAEYHDIPGSTFRRQEIVPVAEFDNVAAFLKWCPAISEPGQSAENNVWD